MPHPLAINKLQGAGGPMLAEVMEKEKGKSSKNQKKRAHLCKTLLKSKEVIAKQTKNQIPMMFLYGYIT